GIVYLIEIKTPDIKIRENSKMEGKLVNKKELIRYENKMERWSQIIIHNFL
ncbi:unnamed protein product, partial [marine sediment metagenome]